MAEINHQETALATLLSQYQNSPNLTDLLSGLMVTSQDIEDQACALFNRFNLDDTNGRPLASGTDLDQIGELLGLPRFAVQYENIDFQFDVTPLDGPARFADLPFLDYELLSDERYICVLRSWGVVLNSKGTVNDIILSLAYLFCTEPANIVVGSVVPFQFDVTPLDGPAAFEGSYTTINIFVNKTLSIEDMSLYNYVAPNGSRLWAKLGGISYQLTSL